MPGFGILDPQGHWQGMEADLCRAVAAMTLGDPQKVNFLPAATAAEARAMLVSGEVDLLSRHVVLTFSRDTDEVFDFPGIWFHDGQGFMVRRSLGIASAASLGIASVCVVAGTRQEAAVTRYFGPGWANNFLRSESSLDEAFSAYKDGECDALSTFVGGLAVLRSWTDRPEEHRILPEIISRDPNGPLVREGDPSWSRIVRFAMNAVLLAEELGISQDNVLHMATADHSDIEWLQQAGDDWNLPADAALRVVHAVGNYGELYERHFGAGGLNLARGRNALWRDGGLHVPGPLASAESAIDITRLAPNQLQEIRARGELRCGAYLSPPFSYWEEEEPVGFSFDLCRAIGVAIFGEDGHVVRIPNSAMDNDEVDIFPLHPVDQNQFLAQPGLELVGNVFYSGLGFVTSAETGLDSAFGIAGARVCVIRDRADFGVLRRFLEGNGISVEYVDVNGWNSGFRKLRRGKCDVFVNDLRRLMEARALNARDTDPAFVILPEILTMQPQGIQIRAGDPKWADLVRWVTNVLIVAEVHGLTAGNVRRAAGAGARGLLKRYDELGKSLTLAPGWPVRVIETVGNYGEIYDRHLGPDSPHPQPRAQNKLWKDGGLLYPMPMR
jgi:general L-amino acid transport system substrate-binding protein